MPAFCLTPFVRYGSTILLHFPYLTFQLVLLQVTCANCLDNLPQDMQGLPRGRVSSDNPISDLPDAIVMAFTRTIYVYNAWSLSQKRYDSTNPFSKPLSEILPTHTVRTKRNTFHQSVRFRFLTSYSQA